MSRALLITGATGKQGGAAINALLELNADFEILALTRNVTSSSAQELAKKSPKIKLVAGDMNKPEEIFKSAKDVTSLPIWGVFSIQVPQTLTHNLRAPQLTTTGPTGQRANRRHGGDTRESAHRRRHRE